VAVTGSYALDYLNEERHEFLKELDFAATRLEESVASLFKQQLENLREFRPIPIHASSELAICFAQLQEHKTKKKEIDSQINEKIKTLEKERAKSRLQSLSGSMDELIASAVSIDNIKLVAVKVSASSIDELKKPWRLTSCKTWQRCWITGLCS